MATSFPFLFATARRSDKRSVGLAALMLGSHPRGANRSAIRNEEVGGLAQRKALWSASIES